MAESQYRSFRLTCPPKYFNLVENLLRAEGFGFSVEPFSAFCRCLTSGSRPLGASLAASFGLIYIQDRSSMLPPLALNPGEGASVLDMCASPGSKTGFLAQLTGKNGFVIGNEPSASRLATLRRNLHVLNLPQAVTASGQGQNLPFAENSFERILLDPPCSGWGTAEKHPNIKKLWRPEKIRPLIALQRSLLQKAALMLKPGGRLVYSTCTTNHEENEEQVLFAIEKLGLKLTPLPAFSGFEYDAPGSGLEGVLRINGEACASQGFFIACFGKEGDEQPQDPGIKPCGLKGRLSCDVFSSSILDAGLLPPGAIFARGDHFFFVPEKGLELFTENLVWQGFLLGKWRNGQGRLSSRLRSLLPDEPPPGSLLLDEVEPLKKLLAGQSLSCGLSGREAGIYWRGLPLGLAQLKSGRVIWTGR